MPHSRRKLHHLLEIRLYFAAGGRNLKHHWSNSEILLYPICRYRIRDLKKQDHGTHLSETGYFTEFSESYPLIDTSLLEDWYYCVILRNMLSPLEGLLRTELCSPVHFLEADPTSPVQTDTQGQSTYQAVRKKTVLQRQEPQLNQNCSVPARMTHLCNRLQKTVCWLVIL